MKTFMIGLVAAIVCAASVQASSDLYPFYRTMLYDNRSLMKNVDGLSFVYAAIHTAEENGPKDCYTQQIGIAEYGLFLHGKKIDDKHYIWVLTENGIVIQIHVVTKR